MENPMQLMEKSAAYCNSRALRRDPVIFTGQPRRNLKGVREFSFTQVCGIISNNFSDATEDVVEIYFVKYLSPTLFAYGVGFLLHSPLPFCTGTNWSYTASTGRHPASPG